MDALPPDKMLRIQEKLSNTFFAILSLPATAMGFALSVQISALSWILSNKYGLDIHDVGLVWAAGPIAGIIGQVLIGVISDNVWFWGGRRRPFILIGGVLAALMLLALPNIDVISSSMGIDGILGVAITVALILDLAINVSFNPTRSVIADVTPEGTNRTKGYAWMQSVSGTLSVGAYGIGVIWDNYVLIYSGAVIVFICSFVPPFFIEENKEMNGNEDTPESNSSTSLREIIMAIRPLWGFLIYDLYAMTMRLAHVEQTNYYMEFICLGVTILLIALELVQVEAGKPKEERNMIGFKKVMAAHGFSWIGVHTMFVYMFFYIQDKYPALTDIDQGRIVSLSFLILNGVAAVLPVLVLEPMAKRIGRVKTHYLSLGAMTIGYVGLVFVGASSVYTVYILMAVCGIGWAAIISLPFAIMSQKVDQTKMGLYMGLFNLSVVLPQLVVSLGVGFAVNQAENKTLIFIISTVMLALSTIAWSRVTEDDDGGESSSPAVGGGH